MHTKLIPPECLQHCAHKLWLSWGIVGVGDDVAGILRHIQGISSKHGEKTTQQAELLLPNFKEKKKVLLVLGIFLRQNMKG